MDEFSVESLVRANQWLAMAVSSDAETQLGSASGGMMLLYVIVMLVTYVGVAYERFHKTVAALLGAAVLVSISVATGLFPYNYVYLILEEDLNIFGVIVGTGILVDVVGRSGLFHFLSMWIVRLTGGRAALLYLALCMLTFLFVAVLTIVPAMLILSSLTLVICRSLGYQPTPFLLSVAICANSGAIATFASGLPNIMLGTAAGIPYVQFLRVSLPFAVLSLLVAIGCLRFFFRNDLPWKQTGDEQAALRAKIAEFDPWALVESRTVLMRSAIILLATVVGFAAAQPLGVGMDFIAMIGGTTAMLFSGKGVEDAISKVNWTVILFFMGLFLIIGCVKATGALSFASEQVIALSGNRLEALIPLLGGFSAVSSSIVDNIPVAATLIPIVKDIEATGVPVESLWWTLIICCNLGGNGTPIGSISCVIAIYALKREAGEVVGWGKFLKIGGTIMLLQVVLAIAYILLLQQFDLIPPIP
ncbi:ArsB/NhaD family transporter [Planctomycetaceae bacterium SH139]